MKITVHYRAKKPRITMRVTRDGNITITAPPGTPDSYIREFIKSKREWIESLPGRFAEIEKKRAAAQERVDEFYARLPLDTDEQCDDAVHRLTALVQPMIVKYEALMGVKVSRLTYTLARTRWGSCNTRTHRINLSIYLLLLPDWCVEHVVVHELAHLLVPNHSADFYAVMDRFFPRWREARQEARRISNRTPDDDDM